MRDSIEIKNASLKKLTTWHIGGAAECLYYPATINDLSHYLQNFHSLHPQADLHFLGLGSNVLIGDQGLAGLVIATRYLHQITLMDKTQVYAQAGLSCAKFAKFCAAQQLSHAEFFAGIPGTIGGALAMNAGAFGGETWDLVVEVYTINRFGELKTRGRSEFDVGYRHVVGKTLEQAEEYFVGALFECTPMSLIGPTSEEKIKLLLRDRNTKQPIGTRNCGSVFRNPEGDHAARLIEAVGLKGFTVGGALISPKHANFIINQGEATAVDVSDLIHLIQARVFEKYAILLKPEVRILEKKDQNNLK